MTKTVRILSLDGGGMRGYASACFFAQFCSQAGIDPTKLYEYFDIIIGTSIGAIQASGYAIGLTPQTLQTFFEDDGPKIFDAWNTVSWVGRAGSATWSATVLATQNDSIDNITSNSEVLYGYDTSAGNEKGQTYLYKRLGDILGEKKMSDVSTKLFLTSYDVSTKEPVLFSNVTGFGTRGQDFLLKDVAISSGSAPVYFKPHLINTTYYIDGGVYENNPAVTAYSAARAYYPLAEKYCVLSIGTGREGVVYPDLQASLKGTNAVGIDDFAGRLGKWFGMAIAGAQESVDKQMQRLVSSPFENVYYHRFQYDVDPSYYAQYPTVDLSTPEFLAYQKAQAEQYIETNQKAITNFIGHLNA